MEVQAGNKLIAVFMGNMKVYRICKDPNAELKDYIIENYRLVSKRRAETLISGMEDEFPNSEIEMDTSVLAFHTSWDWLMPVVEKIRELGYYMLINSATEEVKIFNNYEGGLFDVDYEDKPMILGVYDIVVQFIQWHQLQSANSNK